MVKTTQTKVVKVYKTIEKISGGNMPLPVAYKLFKIKKALAPQFEFQVEQEQKLLGEYKPEYNGDNFTFQNEQDRDAFVGKLNEINNMSVDIELDKQVIPMNAHIELSIDDMEALEEFIEFE